MNSVLAWLAAFIESVLKILDFLSPQAVGADGGAVRSFLLTALDAAATFAAKTTTTVDDLVVTTLKAIVSDDEAWAAIWGLFSKPQYPGTAEQNPAIVETMAGACERNGVEADGDILRAIFDFLAKVLPIILPIFLHQPEPAE